MRLRCAAICIVTFALVSWPAKAQGQCAEMPDGQEICPRLPTTDTPAPPAPPASAKPAPPPPPPPPVRSTPSGLSPISVQNSCPEHIKIWVRHHSLDKEWTTYRFDFKPNETARLRDLRTSNSNVYFWAYIPGTSLIWSGKDSNPDDR